MYDPNDPNKPKNSNPAIPGAPGASQRLRAEQAAGQKKSSGFTGVGRVMQANVGGRLGQQVTGRIGQAGQQAQQQIGQAAQKFQTQLGQAQTQQEGFQQIGDAAFQGIVAPPAQQPVAAAPAQQPVSAIDPATIGAFQQLTSGEYTGPTGLEDLSDLQSQAYAAQQMGEAAQTAGGRMELLQRMYGRGPRQYSASQAALDAMLLGKSAKDLAAARREVAGVSEQLESEQEVAEAQARQAGLETQRTAQETLQKVGATEAQELGRVRAQKKEYEKNLADLSKKVQDEVKSGQLSQETLNIVKKLGIDENSQFYGMPTEEIANMIATTSPAQLSEAAFANEEQVRKLNALRRLSGKEDVFSQADVERVGTMRDPTAGFRFKGDLGTTLQEQRKSFENLFSDLEKEQQSMYKSFSKDVQEKLGGGYKNLGEELKKRVFDSATGKLNVDAVNKMIQNERSRLYETSDRARKGTEEWKAYKKLVQARISALKNMLTKYNGGSTFKLKE